MIDIDSKVTEALHASLAPLLDLLADAIVALINEPETGSRWLSEKQAAEHCATSRRTISDARRRGDIPARRRGRSYIFEIKDLDAWLAPAEVRRPVPPPEREIEAT